MENGKHKKTTKQQMNKRRKQTAALGQKPSRKRSGSSLSREEVVHRNKILLAAGLLVFGLIVIVGVNLWMRHTVKSYDSDVIISGVKIGDTDVSGMHVKKAKKALEETMNTYAEKKVVLSFGDDRTIEIQAGEMGLSVKDMNKLVRSAADYGKKGNPISCYKILKNAEKKKETKVFPIEYVVAEDAAKIVLYEKIDPLLKHPIDASVSSGEDGVTIVSAVHGEKLNVKKTIKNINKALTKEIKKDAIHATVAVSDVDAEIQDEDLAEVTNLLGTFTTYYGATGDGRAQNVESGAEHIGGTLIQPGEEVSANKLMEPYTEENGYAMAASYAGDEVVESMGGGICQVSTTLYNALLMAELEITQRNNHSMTVSYVDLSKDAAIADDVMDLRFKNNTEAPIYIQTQLWDGNVTFNIFGKETRAENRSVKYESELIEEVVSDDVRYLATDEPIGTVKTKDEGKKGYKAQLWKVVYENGEEVSRDVINHSNYVASGKIVEIGTSSEDGKLSEKMKAAVDSQDRAKIDAVIEEAKKAKEGKDEKAEEKTE